MYVYSGMPYVYSLLYILSIVVWGCWWRICVSQRRTRAKHLAALVGKGGEACVSPTNLQGDCEVNCSAVPKDTVQDYKDMLTTLTGPFDLVSVHDYGCYQPYGEREFCNGDPTSLTALNASKEVADALGKPLFVGEFGSPDCVKGGWNYADCTEAHISSFLFSKPEVITSGARLIGAS